MQEKTATYYQQKVEEVLNYINGHLGDDLNIKMLAERFCISFFHFHRIFKAVLNEPLGCYIKRIRLETAVKLIRYSNEPLGDIALRIGYSDLSSFSKAFSKEFGLSPLEFKSNNNSVLNTHIDYHISDAGKIISDIKPKLITLPDREAAFIRVTGRYGGDEVYKAWDELERFASTHNLISWKPDIFSVYYDDPDIVGIDNCSSDLCIVTKKKIKSEGRVKLEIIKGGKFAVFRYKGPYEKLWELYYSIYGNWVLFSDMKLRDSPSIEKYLNYNSKIKPENLLTEIYIPIE